MGIPATDEYHSVMNVSEHFCPNQLTSTYIHYYNISYDHNLMNIVNCGTGYFLQHRYMHNA